MQTLDSKTAHKIVSELVFVMKNGKLTPKFISNIMSKFVGGTDADGVFSRLRYSHWSHAYKNT